MIQDKSRLVSIKNIFLVVYCVIIFCASLYLLKRPAYNWDILPYMGVILSYEKNDIKSTHEKVYAVSKKDIPALFYNRLIDTSINYRKSVAQSPEAFHAQLAFYIVKPLYTGACWLLYKAGFSLPRATVIPSVISYFLISLLLFHWLKKYLSLLFAFTGSILLMFSSPVVSVANLSTPDAFSGLLLFVAMYYFIERRSLRGAFTFLLLAIFARLDNIIPAALFLFAVSFAKKWDRKINVSTFLMLFSLILLSYFTISYPARSFGWSLFYYPTFIKQLNTSYNINNAFVFRDYIALVKSQAMTGLFFSFLSLFIFLVLLLLWNRAGIDFKEMTLEQTFALVFLLIILIRFILQPVIADRFYIPYYLSVFVFLAKKISLPANTYQQSY